MSFSIYDILDSDIIKEADDDENTTSDSGDNTDDTFDDIDTSLDNINSSNITGGGGNTSTTNTSTNSSNNGLDEDEPVESNTDLFSSLSAEEQMIKITELKKQYADLFNSCDDMIDKISTIETTEVTVVAVNRITNILMNLKNYITDYLYTQFASKSYYENDVTFNRFLAIFKSISNILNDISKSNIQNR